ncbi:MAG TPA: hypothetical protein VHK02_06480 [Actinomycetota bacterium]|nr:hypothetical protein [Actinomycetota bacterium]
MTPLAPRRPAPGGGLAVLIVVTVLAALAAPHAKAFRGLVADGLPAIAAPKLPGERPTPRAPKGLTFTNAAGCRPAGDYRSPRLDRRVRTVLVAAAAQYRIRVSCLRTGHSWYVRGTRRVSNHSVWRGVDVDQVDGHPVSPANAAARRLALWIGRGRAGVQPSEVGSPWRFGGRPWFTDAGHQGHLHIGFPGPTRAGAR